MNKEICVFYLFRKSDEWQKIIDFIVSYRGNAPGVDHDMKIVLKGDFSDSKFIDYVSKLKINFVEIPDEGRDISSYVLLSKQFNYKFLVFLNSYSKILHKNWLYILMKPFEKLSTGMVGATGSYASHTSIAYENLKKSVLGLNFLKKIIIFYISRLFFPKFPNPHIRTNAFAIRRDAFLSLRFNMAFIKTRLGSYVAESGYKSICNQLSAKKLDSVLVGLNYEISIKNNWRSNNIFWNGDQSNLLISDNQTKKYDNGSDSERDFLKNIAWGL
jgi:hypothetical protein